MNSKSFACIALLFSLLCSAYSQDVNVSVEDLITYSKWRFSNKRNYLNEEEQIFRQVIFLENLKVINQHNSNSTNTYTIGINQFSDMTQEEFNSKILNNKISEEQGFQSSSSSHEGFQASAFFKQAPSVDWRTKGAISVIKNQGNCGSCWTFSSIALMESVNFIKNGKTSNLAEQQLLDCAIVLNGFYAYGCTGGNAPQALSYAAKFGIVVENFYPYIGIQGKCKVYAITNGFKPKSIIKVGSSVDDLKNALNNSPVAVALDASNWQNYKSGIFNNCGTKLNHAVLAVGYDVQGNWIVKNSYGTTWGENGFIRIAAGNTCGILNFSYTITA